MIHRFKYLKYALAIVLIFIGGKIFFVNLLGKLPAWFSLGVTLSLLLGGVLYSLYRTRGQRSAGAAAEAG
jgi:tellurite resistance protein TerC